MEKIISYCMLTFLCVFYSIVLYFSLLLSEKRNKLIDNDQD